MTALFYNCEVDRLAKERWERLHQYKTLTVETGQKDLMEKRGHEGKKISHNCLAAIEDQYLL